MPRRRGWYPWRLRANWQQLNSILGASDLQVPGDTIKGTEAVYIEGHIGKALSYCEAERYYFSQLERVILGSGFPNLGNLK